MSPRPRTRTWRCTPGVGELASSDRFVGEVQSPVSKKCLDPASRLWFNLFARDSRNLSSQLITRIGDSMTKIIAILLAAILPVSFAWPASSPLLPECTGCAGSTTSIEASDWYILSSGKWAQISINVTDSSNGACEQEGEDCVQINACKFKYKFELNGYDGNPISGYYLDVLEANLDAGGGWPPSGSNRWGSGTGGGEVFDTNGNINIPRTTIGCGKDRLLEARLLDNEGDPAKIRLVCDACIQ